MAEVVKFPFEITNSQIFGQIYRPIARVDFWSKTIKNWVEIIMLVDTGADYTLLPKFYAEDLGVNLEKDCQPFSTLGIGGSETVYLFKKMEVKLGSWRLTVPIGFLEHDNVPPLLGRQNFLEDFRVLLFRHTAEFSDFKKQ